MLTHLEFLEGKWVQGACRDAASTLPSGIASPCLMRNSQNKHSSCTRHVGSQQRETTTLQQCPSTHCLHREGMERSQVSKSHAQHVRWNKSAVLTWHCPAPAEVPLVRWAQWRNRPFPGRGGDAGMRHELSIPHSFTASFMELENRAQHPHTSAAFILRVRQIMVSWSFCACLLKADDSFKDQFS